MIIKILGSGCPNCKRLEANTKKTLKELSLDAEIEKFTGKVPSVKEAKQYF